MRCRSIGRWMVIVFVCLTGFSFAQSIIDAAEKGQLDSTEILLNRDISLVRFQTPGGETPLHIAAYGGHLGVMKLLIDRGACVEALTQYGYSPLHYAAFGRSVEAAALLVSNGADVNIKHLEGQAPLHVAVQQGHAELARFFLNHGAWVNEKDFYGYTPLDIAVDHGVDNTAAILRAHGGVPTPVPEARVRQLSNGLYAFNVPAGQATNIVIQIGYEGTLLVDSGFSKRITGKIKSTLITLGSQSIDWIVNTHSHWDHTAGNDLAKKSSHLIKFSNLDSLEKVGLLSPIQTESQLFSKIYEFKYNGQPIRFIPFPGIHTDTDMLVWFAEQQTVHMGDLLLVHCFPSVRRRVDDYLDFLAEVLSFFPKSTVFVCGHGAECEWKHVENYRHMLNNCTQLLFTMVKKGKSKAEILADPRMKAFAPWEKFIPILNLNYWLNAVILQDKMGLS